jgi:hypothetical protein
MIDEYNDDIDYEHMDDLPLSAHIEWHYSMEAEEDNPEGYEMEWLTS